MNPTPRQKQVLDFITDYIREHGCSPTLKEMATALGMRSLSGVWKDLDALRDRGLIETTENKARSVRIVPQEKTILWAKQEKYVMAWFADNPCRWGSGRTPEEAVGDLVMSWRAELAVSVKEANEERAA